MGLFGSKTKKIEPAKSLTGTVQFPGDKSISHRYAMLGAIAEGASEIHFFSTSADCQSTLSCLKQLGVKIERKDNVVTIEGAGLGGLRPAHRASGRRQLRFDDADAGRHSGRPTVSFRDGGRCFALPAAHEARRRPAFADGSADQVPARWAAAP